MHKQKFKGKATGHHKIQFGRLAEELSKLVNKKSIMLFNRCSPWIYVWTKSIINVSFLYALGAIFLVKLVFIHVRENQVVIEPPVASDSDQNEDDEDDEENDGPVYNESDFKFSDFAKRLPHPKIVRACGLALRNFDTNSVNTNHCILKLLHRIAFDCKMYVMVFQLSIFRTFQKIFNLKDLPQHKELVKFATYIVRQFIKVSETNKKVFMEALFWKSSKECYDVEHGYTTEKSSSAVRAWTEEQEDEVRHLFMEHKQSDNQEDVVDFVTNNLIDQTKSRRQVLKKLKELMLLIDYKKKSGGSRPPKNWSEEEQQHLQELFEQFRESEDPLGNIIRNLDVPRPKNRIVEKLLVMGLIQDKKELRKKRTRKEGKSRSNQSDNSDATNSSDSDDDNISSQRSGSSNVAVPTQKRNKKNAPSKSKKSSGKRRPNKHVPVSKARTAQLLIKVVDSEMQEALEWLKESLSDAIEDYEVGNNEGIPLVPVMDYAETAMENLEFQQMLKALGICPPFDEQEMYWRIPGHLTPDLMQNYCDMIQQALDKTLEVEVETQPIEAPNPTPLNQDSSDEEDIFTKLRTKTKPDSSEIIDENSERSCTGSANEDETETVQNIEEEDGDAQNETAAKNKSRLLTDITEESEDEGSKSPENDINKENETHNATTNDIEEAMEIDGDIIAETISPKKKKSRIIQESDEESDNEPTGNKSPEKENVEDASSFSRRGRIILDSDSEEEKSEAEPKRIRSGSDSDSEKPAAKRGRIVDSEDED